MLRAGVSGHVWGAGELFSDVLPQQEEEVARSEELGLCEVGLLVFGGVFAVRSRRLTFPSFLMEAAEWDVHTESEEDSE